MRLSEAQLKKLAANGKIRGFKQVAGKAKDTPKSNAKREVWARYPDSREKQHIFNQLCTFFMLSPIKMEHEYRFHSTRRWRFDWAYPEIKLAVEYEGIFGGKSRHTTVGGYTGDADKYNAAAADGWTVLRYTAKNYTNVSADLMNLKDKISNQINHF